MDMEKLTEIDESVLQEVSGGRSIVDSPDYNRYKGSHGRGEDWDEPGVGHLYVINSGDSLSSIGKKFGLHWRMILLANRQIRNPNLIFVGSVIKIPLK